MTQADYERVGSFLMRGDVPGAIAFMKGNPELEEVAAAYLSVFEKEQYIRYDVPEKLNELLLCYQQYFRDVFFLRIAPERAEAVLFEKLKRELASVTGDPSAIEEKLARCFHQGGCRFLGGKTNGYYGPYVWKETVPMTFDVELPETAGSYCVHMLRGVILRGWMDYLTFGERGTGGWTMPDGTIYCVERAYDINSERFRVSFLKHEAQHAEDRRRWPDMEPRHLEYRAKLVELIYARETDLLEKFCREADPNKTDDSHAAASARIKREMGDGSFAGVGEIQSRAKTLFAASSQEMAQYYG